MGRGGKPRDFDLNYPVLVFGRSIRNEDLCRKFFVGRSDEEDLSVESQLADDGFPRPLGHSDDATFGSSARFPVGDFDLHLVAVHRSVRQRRRNEDVAVYARDFLRGHDESITVAMKQDRPFEGGARGRFEAASLVRLSFPSFTSCVRMSLICRRASGVASNSIRSWCRLALRPSAFWIDRRTSSLLILLALALFLRPAHFDQSIDFIG